MGRIFGKVNSENWPGLRPPAHTPGPESRPGQVQGKDQGLPGPGPAWAPLPSPSPPHPPGSGQGLGPRPERTRKGKEPLRLITGCMNKRGCIDQSWHTHCEHHKCRTKLPGQVSSHVQTQTFTIPALPVESLMSWRAQRP